MSVPTALTFVDPTTVVAQLSIEPGNRVADFGCGSGYFTFEFSKKVGPEGVVHALDVLPSALEAVASRAKSLNLLNITAKRVNLEKERGSGLTDNSIDWVIIKDILFQNQKKDVILREVARVLKPGGHVLIMEWSPTNAMVGPEKNLRISPEDLKKLLAEARLSVDKELNVGEFHYAFVAKK